jgi:hypothetical protein
MGDSIGFISYIDPHARDHHGVAFRYNEPGTILGTYHVICFCDDPPADFICDTYSTLNDLINTLVDGNIYLAYEHTPKLHTSAALEFIENAKLVYAKCRRIF